MFRRSDSGLRSIHVFYGADVVIYCEGGETRKNVNKGDIHIDGDTLDIIYWRTIVAHLTLGSRFHFKSAGSKSALTELGQSIEKLKLENVTICCDSDYDRIRGVHLNFQRCAWTMGYSWENDVVRPPILERLVAKILGDGPSCAELVGTLRQTLTKFQKDLQPWAETDISLCARRHAGIFDRQKPLAVIEVESAPTLKVAKLKKRLVDAGFTRRPRKIIGISTERVLEICYGKMIARALYHTVIILLKNYTNIRIEYELFMRLAIGEMGEALKNGLIPEFRQHIERQRNAFLVVRA